MAACANSTRRAMTVSISGHKRTCGGTCCALRSAASASLNTGLSSHTIQSMSLRTPPSQRRTFQLLHDLARSTRVTYSRQCSV
eukprot:3641935-Pleurochrysis_carterae.AAC.1